MSRFSIPFPSARTRPSRRYGSVRRWIQGVALTLALLPTAGILGSPTARASEPVTLTALGDSLTAGYNLPQDAAFPVRLQAALRDKGYDVTVINAGVSGDTSAGGLSRLDWMLGDDPDGVIVELGANDGLRGLDPATTKEHLGTIITRLKDKGVAVLLAGMLAPPNLGRDYGAEFNALYGDLATEYDIPLYPFFLEGVAGHPALNLEDGIHPTPEGVDIIVAGILPQVEALIDRIRSKRGAAGLSQ